MENPNVDSQKMIMFYTLRQSLFIPHQLLNQMIHLILQTQLFVQHLCGWTELQMLQLTSLLMEMTLLEIFHLLLVISWFYIELFQWLAQSSPVHKAYCYLVKVSVPQILILTMNQSGVFWKLILSNHHPFRIIFINFLTGLLFQKEMKN